MTDGEGKKRCPGTSVWIRILVVLHEKGGQRPTRLAWASRLSYDILQICLDMLKRNGHVTVTRMDDGHDLVRITAAGAELLRNYEENFSRLVAGE